MEYRETFIIMRCGIFTSVPLDGGGSLYYGRANHPRSFLKSLLKAGVDARVIAGSSKLQRWRKYSAISTASLLMGKGRFDVVHGFAHDNVMWSLLKNRPYAVTTLGVIADEIKSAKTHGYFNWERHEIWNLLALMEKLNLARADAVTASTKYTRSRIVDLYKIPPKKISIVPPAIPVDKYRNKRPASRAKGELNLLFVGKITPRKGMDYLLKALSIVRKKGLPVRLRIVGSGYGEQDIRNQADKLKLNNSVKFVGTVSEEQKYKELEMCDVLCLPSLQEGFGAVIQEAFASQRPAIVTNVASLPEVVTDGRDGRLVRPGDENSLAGAIVDMADNPGIRAQMGIMARQKAERLWSYEVIGERLKKIYLDIL